MNRAMRARSWLKEMRLPVFLPSPPMNRWHKAEHSRAMRRAAANDVEERLDGDLDEWDLADIWDPDPDYPCGCDECTGDLPFPVEATPLRVPLALFARSA